MKNTGAVVVICLFLVLILFGAWWLYQDGEQILMALRVLMYAAITAAICTTVIVILVAGSNRFADTRQKLAEAQRALRDAQITVTQAGPHDQVYISDTNKKATWRAAHRDPRILATDGQWTDPRPEEWRAMLTWLAATAARANVAIPADPESDWQIEQPPPPLLDTIYKMECGLIVGAKGSGKTTLLQHVISRQRGDVIVIDPHDDTHTWPPNAQVVGRGQDYPAIESALYQFSEDIVKARYQQRATGSQPHFDYMTLIIDEWWEVGQQVKGAADYMMIALTGGRKINTNLVIGSHSERVRALGIEGVGDLKKGFFIVRLKGDRHKGFRATLDTGEGEFPISLPGPYVPTVAGQAMIDTSLPPPAAAKEQRILEKYRAGTTITEIGRQEFGDGRSKGGEQNELVKEVLRKFGVSV